MLKVKYFSSAEDLCKFNNEYKGQPAYIETICFDSLLNKYILFYIEDKKPIKNDKKSFWDLFKK